MTPAVKLALAYCYARGELPKGIHLGTWSAAHAHCVLIEDTNARIRSGRMYELSAEALEAIAGHPLKLACDALAALGFKPSRAGRNTAHYVEFEHGERPLRALAYRSGGATITARHGEVPYRTSWPLEEAQPVWPAILRPAHYAGEARDGETGRDYLQRAIGAYQESDNGSR